MLAKAPVAAQPSTIYVAAGSVPRLPHARARRSPAPCMHFRCSTSCERTLPGKVRSGRGDINSSSNREDDSCGRADAEEAAGTGGGFGSKGGAGQNGGGDGSSLEPTGNEGPHSYPKWLQVWIWATIALYLVARTKWRLDKWQLRREQEQEAALQTQQDQEWQRFVGEYAGKTISSANQQGTQQR
ncbi:hypothetical protein DUNSADRAFT_6834 [Dunaliella salina]|uniref:Uncharacterized protein n=1 Tax=Dunaliella salina TaxID=3046 RepID=A0ABQ7GMK1_DUNSA|nr:hypothetical protein DUNSADRAFT_6834 [Dunaliella salina]|eukprot:KAF5835847.1 hypothetical protein DUNSADRAFT_6834 [Dunaliella salina]